MLYHDFEPDVITTIFGVRILSVVTRFAPSPTGMLHIGGARTALFNALYAKRHGGKFILRIDDTDRARSTDAAVAAILHGLTWLGLSWDEGPIYQHQRIEKHRAIALQLLAEGRAYPCYASAAELAEMRAAAERAHLPPRYNGLWRDRDPATAPADIAPVIRLRAPQDGNTVIDDLVLGRIEIKNTELDDFILLRSDGSPTYMLSTVVDDIDLGVTHIIRGNEHLVNAARQSQIIDAMGLLRPAYAHLPLIHGADGAKLSKRHGAVGVEAYRDLGFLPDAMIDYLIRLGWSNNAEFLSFAAAAQIFDLGQVGKAAARFDLDKLTSINFHYVKTSDDARLVALAEPFIVALIGAPLDALSRLRLLAGMPGLKERAKTLKHLAENALIYVQARPLVFDPAASSLLTPAAKLHLAALKEKLQTLDEWSESAINDALHEIIAASGLGFGKVAQPVRAALTGRTNAPGVAEMLAVFGRDESLTRLEHALQN